MSKKLLNIIEDELYSLTTQIEYGDVSDIDAYWESIASLFFKLRITGWDKPLEKHNLSIVDVISSLKSIPAMQSNDDLDTIISEIQDMEELSTSGSSGTVSEEDLEEMQMSVQGLENDFLNLLHQIGSLL
jgi:hypothetical protein